MKSKTFLLGMMVLIPLSLLNLSCEDDSPKDILQPDLPEPDIDKFAKNLENYITWNNDEPIGWSYSISKNGVLRKAKAFGSARTIADGQLDYKTTKKINVASVSKFYTAIAVMQLLEANDLTIDDKIVSYLPPAWWNVGPGVDNLTFRELLTHTSGLQSTNTDFSNTLSYAGIKSCIETGVVNSKDRNYLNVNFALFRILIPSLWSGMPDAPTMDLNSDASTQFVYQAYMLQNVFQPIGLNNVDCVPEGRMQSLLYYNVGNQISGNGLYYGDWTAMAGGGGFFMTTIEMAAVNAYFEHSEILLSKEQRDIMKENRIGLDQGLGSMELHGEYYGKNGSIVNGGKGVLIQIEMFPLNGIDCVVTMNTQGVTFKNSSLKRTIYEAYNDSWE
jgi:D-alanyl-D-alanine carboxypeptidase